MKRKMQLLALAMIAALSMFAVAADAESSQPVVISGSQKQAVVRLEKEAIQYFLDNQVENGLILDRQRNSGPLLQDGMCSISATGMGLIAIAVASDSHHNMITREDAIARIKKALTTAEKLHSEHGLMPHFLNAKTLAAIGSDAISTIDSSWLLAGALWSSQYLDDKELKSLANKLYDRVDWTFWSRRTKDGAVQLAMGMDADGHLLKSSWNRLNGEAAFMYALAIGATEHALPAQTWNSLDPVLTRVAGQEIASGDLGLFVFQYSNNLMDLQDYHGKPDLPAEAVKAVAANYQFCRQASDKFKTYKTLWGLSAGDGPPDKPGEQDAYRAYAPDGGIDGTAHITATLASIETKPDLVLENIEAAEVVPKAHARYGFSNVNLDRGWVSNDVVGIDMGAEVMGIENELYDDVIQKTWKAMPVAKRALSRINELATNLPK